MATTKSRTNSPLQSTRQMLDELDTLMERMLALPVGDDEDLPPLPRDMPTAPTLKATLTPIADRTTLDEEYPAETDRGYSTEPIDDDLGDAEKVKFSQTETAATLAHLDELLSELDGLRARVDDPDGLISLTLGFDGRLLELRIADAIGRVMTNLELEKRLNNLFAAGTQGVDAMREDLL